MATISLQRSKKLLEEQNYKTWIVEKPFNPYTKRREDLFNFADLVGIRQDIPGVTAIQATGEDVSSHIKKLLEGGTDTKGVGYPPNPYIAIWLRAKNRFFIWAWRKRGAAGKRKLWELREVEFILKDGQVVAQENQVTPQLD